MVSHLSEEICRSLFADHDFQPSLTWYKILCIESSGDSIEYVRSLSLFRRTLRSFLGLDLVKQRIHGCSDC